jgi:hypothetical protein
MQISFLKGQFREKQEQLAREKQHEFFKSK